MHHPKNMTPNQASKKKWKKKVFSNQQDKKEKHILKCGLADQLELQNFKKFSKKKTLQNGATSHIQ